MTRWFPLLLISGLVCACGGHLSRPQAAEMIYKNEIQFKIPATIGIPLGNARPVGGRGPLSDCMFDETEVAWALDHGFIKTVHSGEGLIIALTPEGKKAEHIELGGTKENRCRTAMLTVGTLGKPEVTGIVEDGANAKIDFHYQITPANGADDIFANPEKLSSLSKNAIAYGIGTFPPAKVGNQFIGWGTALFKKYDDGWRVQNVSMKLDN